MKDVGPSTAPRALSPQDKLLRLQRVAGNKAVVRKLLTEPQTAPLALYPDPTDTGLERTPSERFPARSRSASLAD